MYFEINLCLFFFLHNQYIYIFFFFTFIEVLLLIRLLSRSIWMLVIYMFFFLIEDIQWKFLFYRAFKKIRLSLIYIYIICFTVFSSAVILTELNKLFGKTFINEITYKYKKFYSHWENICLEKYRTQTFSLEAEWKALIFDILF